MIVWIGVGPIVAMAACSAYGGHLGVRRDPEILHDGDWFMERATRDARRATLGAAMLLVLICAAIWAVTEMTA